MSRRGSRDGGFLGSLPVTRGALAGVGAFAVGYVLTYLTKSGGVEDKTPDDGVMTVDSNGEETDLTFSEMEVDPPEVSEFVSWLFYEMHNVDMAGTLTYTEIRNGETVRIQEYDLLLGVDVETYLMLVPPVLLAAAGYWVVSSMVPHDVEEAAKAGATVTGGYFVAAVLSAVVFVYNDLHTESQGSDWEYTVEAAYSVDLQSAAIMAGIVYPLAFGALGGYIAYRRTAAAGPAPGRREPRRNPQQRPPRRESAGGNRDGRAGGNRNGRGDTRRADRQGTQRGGRQGANQRRQSDQARRGRSGHSGDDSGRP
jgi:hypothetical protein